MQKSKDSLKDRLENVNIVKCVLFRQCNVYGIKVSKGAKIRNRYNQVPHLTQDTNGKVTNSQKTPQTRAKRSALSQHFCYRCLSMSLHNSVVRATNMEFAIITVVIKTLYINFLPICQQDSHG